MSEIVFLQACKQGAGSFLKSFHFDCRRIAPSATGGYAFGHEVLYFSYKEISTAFDFLGETVKEKG